MQRILLLLVTSILMIKMKCSNFYLLNRLQNNSKISRALFFPKRIQFFVIESLRSIFKMTITLCFKINSSLSMKALVLKKKNCYYILALKKYKVENISNYYKTNLSNLTSYKNQSITGWKRKDHPNSDPNHGKLIYQYLSLSKLWKSFHMPSM